MHFLIFYKLFWKIFQNSFENVLVALKRADC